MITQINQAHALAGSVTPGDPPGFPVTISLPGSYELTSNLEVPAASAHAIEITASHVTVNLNGFLIFKKVPEIASRASSLKVPTRRQPLASGSATLELPAGTRSLKWPRGLPSEKTVE
jgi:hypothetical protein